ncbi:hypothetical protein N665_2740s0001, partial [Sinapis alba]
NGLINDTNQGMYDQHSEQRPSKLTELVCKQWSLAPPNNSDMNHNHHHHFDRTNDDVYLLSRPLTDINQSFNPGFKALNLKSLARKSIKRHPCVICTVDAKHEHGSSLQATTRLGTTNSGKKIRFDEVSDEVSKRAKCAKLRDKITTLRQIVSPFGKEAITFINFISRASKGQLIIWLSFTIMQLLSTPSMKNSSIKDPWGAWDREDHNKIEPKHLCLNSRGLCLVPISCNPIAYRDNRATDYWSPSYRGSLYR